MNYYPDERSIYSQARTEPTDPSLIPAPKLIKCAYPLCNETFVLHSKSRRKYCDKTCVQKHRRDKEADRGRARRAHVALHPKPVNPLIAGDQWGNRLVHPDWRSWVAAYNQEHHPEQLPSDVCARYAPEGMA